MIKRIKDFITWIAVFNSTIFIVCGWMELAFYACKTVYKRIEKATEWRENE